MKRGGMCMTKLSTIEGIGNVFEEKLKAAGIGSVETLLKACTTKKGRKLVAKQTQISDKLILKWTNHADLMRIKGVGGEYAELLEAAGVDTVPDLSNRNSENLAEKIKSVNDEKALVRQIPALSQLQDWIQQAKVLPRVIEY